MLRTALLALLLAAALLAAALPAAAQTQGEMTAEACAARDASDAALNTAYRDAGAAMPTALARRRLRDAQRAWIRFRDAELEALFPLAPGADPRYEYGSIYPMELCTEERRLVDARTAELRAHARCASGGDPTCL